MSTTLHLPALALVLIPVIGGILTTYGAAIINAPHWGPKVKHAVALVVAVALGIFGAYTAGELDGADLAAAALATYAASQLAYHTLTRPSATSVEMTFGTGSGATLETNDDAGMARVDVVLAALALVTLAGIVAYGIALSLRY